MNEILVPADPADLIDRIIELQLRIDAMPANQRSEMLRKRDLLTRLAGRIMPPDDDLADLTEQLFTARSDIFNLTQELLACDARKDYSTAFVALSQSLLAAMTALDRIKGAINSHVAPVIPASTGRTDA
ncbi:MULTISPECIES: hypothetical protein [unclassified Yoonia]|uniref:hypothetical protein n=1 Tax=unclassified Yoonia TaxID=2629118 RepID=UPI002AFECD42|nr:MULTISPECIES: hypothetical protein [unclassified Yoonia]